MKFRRPAAQAEQEGRVGVLGAGLRLFGGGYAEPASGGLRIGQTVEHAKFGIGVIVSTEGRRRCAVQVNFGGSGMKWLALEYAKLTPV
jgi:DNA helicase-2/ATP-dependent DNA helicase PcrA